MEPSETVPAWKREILVRRKLSQSYQRSTDVLGTSHSGGGNGVKDVLNHHYSSSPPEEPALKSPSKTADIIKFFNRRSDGDSVPVVFRDSLQQSGSNGQESHLASKTDIFEGIVLIIVRIC